MWGIDPTAIARSGWHSHLLTHWREVIAQKVRYFTHLPKAVASQENDVTKPRKQARDPGFILDAAQAIVAIAVAIVLALDMTGIWSNIPWLSGNLTGLTFIAVCVLIVSSFLERRVVIEELKRITNQKLDHMLSRQREISERIREFTPPTIRLEDRRGYTEPFEVRLADAQHVDLLGLSLLGIVASCGSFLLARAMAGCKFRILLIDPDSHAASTAVGFVEDVQYRKPDIERSIRNLEPLLETGNVELRLMPVVPPFGLLIIDPDKPQGKVQVELYGHEIATSDRPHFVLTQTIDKQWYDFFRNQFLKFWNDAQPHGAQWGNHHSPS